MQFSLGSNDMIYRVECEIKNGNFLGTSTVITEVIEVL